MRVNLGKVVDELAMEVFGLTPKEAHLRGICIQCQQSALEKIHTEAGREEYKLSALCEECFDEIRKEE